MDLIDNWNSAIVWDDTASIHGEYAGKPATLEYFQGIEQELGYKLPEAYWALIAQSNGGGLLRDTFYLPNSEVRLRGILGIDRAKPRSLCGEKGNAYWITQRLYPPVGVVLADTWEGDHQKIFLDYSQCGKEGEPRVVLLSQEANPHIPEPTLEEIQFEEGDSLSLCNITLLANSLEEFTEKLTFTREEPFSTFRESQQIFIVQLLHFVEKHDQVIRLLTEELEEEALSTPLLHGLARAYNNIEEEDEALRILQWIPEAERGSLWHYRVGYGYLFRSFPESPMKDYLQALRHLEQAVTDVNEKIVALCVDLIENFQILPLLKQSGIGKKTLYPICVAAKQKKEAEARAQGLTPIDKTGLFEGAILLREAHWDWEHYLQLVQTEWNISLQDVNVNEDEGTLTATYSDTQVRIQLFASPVPDKQAEIDISDNIYWHDEEEEVSTHQAYGYITVINKEQALHSSMLFATLMAAACMQEGAIGVHMNEVVLEKTAYIKEAQLIKDNTFPIECVVWQGIYKQHGQLHGYTRGMERFGKLNLEYFCWDDELPKLLYLLMDWCSKMILETLTPNDDNTISSSLFPDKRYTLQCSPGMHVLFGEGMTLKIKCVNP